MRFRRVVIFSRVSRSPGVAPFPRGCGATVGRCCVGAAKTSGFDTTPPRPVPAMAAMLIPRSSAILRAAGEDLVLSACAGAAGCDAVRDGAAGAEGAAVAAVAAEAPTVAGTAVSSSSPRISSTCTTSPSAFERLARTPGLSAGTSTVILSVSRKRWPQRWILRAAGPLWGAFRLIRSGWKSKSVSSGHTTLRAASLCHD